MSTVPTLPAPTRLPALVLVVTTRAAFWVVWLVGLLIWAPRVENVFQRFNLLLPLTTSSVLALTHGLVPFGLLLVLFFIALDGSVSYRLRRSDIRALWSGLMTAALFVVIIFTAAVLCRPMLVLLEALIREFSKYNGV